MCVCVCVCVRVCVLRLTVSLDVEAERALQLADVIADADVQAVDADGGEGVVQSQGVFIQHGQRAAPRHVRHTVGQETPAHPHGRTKGTQTHRHIC